MGLYVIVAVLILITCVLLTLIVLVQSSKGGGLASNFSSQNQFMGVRKTADFLEKSTWSLAIALLVFSLISFAVIPRNQNFDTLNETELKENIENLPEPVEDFIPMPEEGE